MNNIQVSSQLTDNHPLLLEDDFEVILAARKEEYKKRFVNVIKIQEIVIGHWDSTIIYEIDRDGARLTSQTHFFFISCDMRH